MGAHLPLAALPVATALSGLVLMGTNGTPPARSPAQHTRPATAHHHAPLVRHTARPVAVPASVAAQPSVNQMLGQRIMVGLGGTSASPSLLAQVRRGQVGAVILFSYNIVSRSQVRALTRSLQAAAKAGRNPPLLIAVDQEGGEVKRFANAPPYLSPPQIANSGSVATARSQGTQTGRYLAGVGVNMDLAPVADVPTSTNAFIWQQGRAFSFSPSAVARYSTAFALGVQSAGVAATAKHFPGLGSAGLDTDYGFVVLRPSAAQRGAALVPYRSLIPGGVDAVLVAVAAYPAYDSAHVPAALSSKIIGGLLRGQLHFKGVTITDGLGAPTGHDEVTAGVLAAEAGADILLYTDNPAGELPALRAAVSRGRISMASALACYRRIVALKQHLIH